MTIWEKLRQKLGRNPTSTECATECRRIIREATLAAAEKGKLRHQKR